MPTEHVGQPRHAHQHGGQQQVVAQRRPVQQQGVGAFVHGKAACRNGKKAPCRRAQRVAMAAKAEVVVAAKRHAKRHQPAQHIGPQRRQACPGHAGRGHRPMHGGGGAAHHNEPRHTPALALRPARTRGN